LGFNGSSGAFAVIESIERGAGNFIVAIASGLGIGCGGKYDLSKQCAILAAAFPFADELNSMARQSAAERAWAAISRFYDNCKKKISGLKGFPQFQKDNRSAEYKTTGWKLADDRKSITFTDKKGIGKLKMRRFAD
jgi:putative transposase